MLFPCFNNDFDQIYIGHTFLHLDASIEKLCTSFPIKHITTVNHESIYFICFSFVEGSDVLKQMGLLSTIQQSHRHIMLRLIVTVHFRQLQINIHNLQIRHLSWMDTVW